MVEVTTDTVIGTTCEVQGSANWKPVIFELVKRGEYYNPVFISVPEEKI